MAILDSFFNLGNRVTKGDIVRKAKFDYELYWVVFLSFVCIGFSYFYKFFTGTAGISTLLWGVVIVIFCWFNYWGLVGFRQVYLNIKEAKQKLNKINTPEKTEDVNEMMEGFK